VLDPVGCQAVKDSRINDKSIGLMFGLLWCLRA
jgi:hypothetical protein